MHVCYLSTITSLFFRLIGYNLRRLDILIGHVYTAEQLRFDSCSKLPTLLSISLRQSIVLKKKNQPYMTHTHTHMKKIFNGSAFLPLRCDPKDLNNS